MFEFQKLLNREPTRIVVQTKRGRDIENEVGPELTDDHLRLYEALVNKFGATWQRRKPATAGYNCAGHIWASRRTSIYEFEEVRKILEDDGYRRTDHPLPDDVVLYTDQQIGWLHASRVIQLQEGITAQSRPIPLVVSKMNWGGEVIHSAFHSPFTSPTFDLIIEYWTDRPINERSEV